MKTDRKNSKRGNVLTYFDNLKSGDSFYTELKPNFITVYANRYNKQIKTEVCLVMSEYRSLTPIVKRLTKVTIL